jgi:DNA primase
MAKYSETVIEEIKSRLSLVDVISQYMTLTSKGDRYWGRCPFHEDKTPSFSVLPEKGFYHCFSCKRSGSIFDFVMEMEHVTFPEAVQMLAAKAGVALHEESEEDKKRRDTVEALYELYERLAGSFHYILLNSPQAGKAREYLKQRKVADDMIEKFQLGFAPADSAWLFDFLTKKKYSETLLSTSGLFSKRNPRFPLFRNRIMFPIRTWQAKTVAFGGRDLSGEERAPKYINTPDTPIYSKKHILFGMYEALPALKELNQVTLCEGNFDVIAMHQSGRMDAVAPLGTAFTPEQAKLIRRYCDKAYFVFDSDAAGQASTGKALVTCQAIGMENFVMHIEGGKDASEVVEKLGEEALKQSLSRSMQGFDYLVQNAINQYDVQKPKGKSAVFSAVKPYLDATDSEIERQSYVRHLADILKVDESTIIGDYQQAVGSSVSAAAQRQDPFQQMPLNPAKATLDLYAMLALINNRQLFKSSRRLLKIEDLEDQAAVELYIVLEDATREGVGKSDEVVLQMIHDDRLRQLVATSFQTEEFKANPEGVLAEAIDRIRLRKLLKRQRNNVNLLTLAESEGGGASELVDLLLEKQEIDRDIAEIRNRLASTTDMMPPWGKDA